LPAWRQRFASGGRRQRVEREPLRRIGIAAQTIADAGKSGADMRLFDDS
jgi:hypothetical protein